jgi:putative nucleotidyltransferase with HDIG domain
VGKQLEQSLKQLSRTMEATIQAISTTIEARDPYTAGHQRRVTQLAGVIARDMNLPGAQIAGIRVAGLLHDIGKISIPTEILSKPGQLTDVEMSMIRTHPKVGYDILRSIEFEWPVAQIVLQHHERLDGSGYPSGIRGDEILLEARILAVADVVEAMSSHRPYRPAVGVDKALEEITRGEGIVYDPRVVRACVEVFTKRAFEFEE